MTDPTPVTDVRPDPHVGARVSGSSCRPTTRPRTSGRSRPPSSRPCRRRRCSSSTTTRPTGPADLADDLAAADPRIRVRHRAAKQGLGRAYLDGFAHRARRRCRRSSSRWTPTSATTRPSCPTLVAPIAEARPTSSSGRATRAGGGVVDWGLGRRLDLARRQPVRADRPRPRPARPDRRLQGLACGDAGGRPVRRGPRRRLRLPDRDDVPGGSRAERAIARSRSRSAIDASASRKMSRRIIVEALVVVVQLRAEELRRPGPAAAAGGHDRAARRASRRRRPRPGRSCPGCGSCSTPDRSRRRTGRR